jgi:hypothetical protein
MMNCNPETVSTDYDTSSRLYFEPITGAERNTAVVALHQGSLKQQRLLFKQQILTIAFSKGM